MLLCGRCGGVSGCTDPSTVHGRSSPARRAIAASSVRSTCQSARPQLAWPTCAGPVTDMIRLCGEQVAPSGKWMIRAPTRRACRMSSRTSRPLRPNWPLSPGSSRTTTCAVASLTGFASGAVSTRCAGRTCRRAAEYDSPVLAARTYTALEIPVSCHLAFVHVPATASPASLPETDGPGRRPEIRSPFASRAGRAGAGRRRFGVGYAAFILARPGKLVNYPARGTSRLPHPAHHPCPRLGSSAQITCRARTGWRRCSPMGSARPRRSSLYKPPEHPGGSAPSADAGRYFHYPPGM